MQRTDLKESIENYDLPDQIYIQSASRETFDKYLYTLFTQMQTLSPSQDIHFYEKIVWHGHVFKGGLVNGIIW